MKAMPLFGSIALKSFRQASRPPAEAPIPTTQKFDDSDGRPRAGAERRFDRGRAALAAFARPSAIFYFLENTRLLRKAKRAHYQSYLRVAMRARKAEQYSNGLGPLASKKVSTSAVEFAIWGPYI
jgi:hypothetical protein